MNPMKRLALVALLLVGVTLLASTPAPAGAGEDWGTIELTNTGEEPCASGDATLRKVEYEFFWYDPFRPGGLFGYRCTAVLTVACQNLTPRATYWTPAGTFTADRRGAATIRGAVSFDVAWRKDPWTGSTTLVDWLVVEVIRLDPDGSSATLLRGDFFPP